MRILRLTMMLLILQSLITGVAAQESLSQDDTLKELSSDLTALDLMVQETNYNIQEFQKTQMTLLEPRSLTITGQEVVIYKGAGEETPKLSTVGPDKSLQIIDKEGDWYKVSLDEPIQGQSTGWVHSEYIVPTFIFNPISEAKIRAFIEQKFNDILNAALKIKEKYKNNAYVYIPGFRIAFPPQVQIEIKFKEAGNNPEK